MTNALLAQRNRKKARLSAADAATCDRLLRALDALRLERDLSYPALATEMRRVGYPLGPRTLHQLLRHTGSTRRPTRPHDRTLHKIQRFLELTHAPAAEPVTSAPTVEP